MLRRSFNYRCLANIRKKFIANYLHSYIHREFTPESKIGGHIIRSYVQQVKAEPLETSVRSTGKKRVTRGKKIVEETTPPGFRNVTAFVTAEEYDTDALLKELQCYELYKVSNTLKNSKTGASPAEFIHLVSKDGEEKETQDLYIFREGTLIAWNIPDEQLRSLLYLLKRYEINSFDDTIVNDEKEVMRYTFSSNNKKSALNNGNIFLTMEKTTVDSDKYTFSNVMALSVKLGAWEELLDRYVQSMERVTMDLKLGREIRLSRKQVLQKTGELYALRHSINLTSGLLDLPDFYWEEEDLERLYLHTCNYFNIPRRTRVMNDKINHCSELVDLLSSQLSDKHHIRLEWMIILLIMVEVAFEFIHYIQDSLLKLP